MFNVAAQGKDILSRSGEKYDSSVKRSQPNKGVVDIIVGAGEWGRGVGGEAWGGVVKNGKRYQAVYPRVT